VSVSVIIPVYNGEAFLEQALDSVFAQRCPDLEVIVVDDGSVDGSCDIVKRYQQITLVSQANRGVAAARNVGLQHATGLFLSFLDQDDLWQPQKIEQQLHYLRDHPQVGIVSCHTEFFLDGVTHKPDWLRQERLAQAGKNFSLGSCLIRRATFESVGYFDERYRMASDHDWFVRAIENGWAKNHVDAVLLRRRVHKGNHSQDPQSVREMLAIHRASIKRKQAEIS